MSNWQKTHFVVPQWWVRAYDYASGSRVKEILPDSLSQEQGLVPALNTVELNSLAVLISELQPQILDGTDWLGIDGREHRKYMSMGRHSEQFAFQRMVHILPALCVFPPAKSDTKALPQSIFNAQKISSTDKGLEFQLKVSKLGAELLLG